MSPRRPYRVRFRTRLESPRFRYGLYIYAILVVPYLVWRASVINWHVWYGPAVFVPEIYNAVMTLLFLFIAQRIDLPKPRHARLTEHTVDVLIPTYNEPYEIVEPTVLAATKIKGVRRVLVLDDGNRPWVREMAASLGAEWYPRTTNKHAKAGNLNNGLKHTDAEFLICLDADHVPLQHFAERTLGYFDDPQLAFVQTPQSFYNTQSFLFRRTRRGLWSEQGMFYDVLQPAKNRWNAAFFVGTSAMLRRSALDSVGGFATGTATEDIHTSLRLHAGGWKSVFVNQPLAYGLEAENLKEYFRQRRRWAAGSLGLLLRSPDSPLRVRGLSLPQRLNYLSACLAHVLGVQKLLYYWLPILCIILLASPTTVSWASAATVMLGFAVVSIGFTVMYARGTYHWIYTEAYNMSHAAAHIMGLWGIIKVQKKFSVSRKIVGRRERTWLKPFWWGLLAIGVGALIRCGWLAEGALVHHTGSLSLLVVSFVFDTYNLVILLSFFLYVLLYERRQMSPPSAPAVAKAPSAPQLEPAFYERVPVREPVKT